MDSQGQQRLRWQHARVTAVVDQTLSVKSFFLKPEDWRSFVAGQHVDIRLTAPDGYQAQRSYSIASAPEAPELELVIEELDQGEVSPFFHEVVVPGDTIELRGPIGGHFNWQAEDGGPLLLVGGGSGIVPLMSITRHRALVAPEIPVLLAYYTRSASDVIFREELVARTRSDPNFQLHLSLTREQPDDRLTRSGRIDIAMASELRAAFGSDLPRHTYVCGGNAFVDVASSLLIEAGIPFGTIRTERFGGDPAPR